jgi:hypothetical protein
VRVIVHLHEAGRRSRILPNRLPSTPSWDLYAN